MVSVQKTLKDPKTLRPSPDLLFYFSYLFRVSVCSVVSREKKDVVNT